MTTENIRHVDLPALRETRSVLLEAGYAPDAYPVAMTDRLIAAAEADAPPLPAGWYLLDQNPGDGLLDFHRQGWVYALWHDGEGGLWSRPGKATVQGGAYFGKVELFRDRLTPLRPTVTEADVERAAEAWLEDRMSGVAPWCCLHPEQRDPYLRSMRAAFEAAGIEVTP